MRRNEFTVWLKIRHADADPDLLTRTFGLEADYSGWNEEPKGRREGDVARGRSYWVACVPPMLPERPCLEATLMIGACVLERNSDFWAKLQGRGASAELLVVLEERALSRFELPHELLVRLSKLGLSLTVDVCDAAEAAA